MTKNAECFFELFEITGTADNYTERSIAGARIIEGWELLVKNTASKAIGNMLII